MVIKPGKNPCLVWDGTNKMSAADITMNEITPTDQEPEITFGHTKLNALIHIYNTRISFPTNDIFCAAPAGSLPTLLVFLVSSLVIFMLRRRWFLALLFPLHVGSLFVVL